MNTLILFLFLIYIYIYIYIFLFYCQWFDNLAIASEIKEKNLNTDYYLTMCPQVNR